MEDIELVSDTPKIIQTIERAQIDSQIATAKQYPRVLSEVKEKMLSFVTLDEETAASCFYNLKRGGKNIQGPSVRLAEIAVSSYKNIQAGSRVIANDGKTITSQAVCYDTENNIRITIEVPRRITDKNGKTFSDDMQVVTANAACAIALRNAVFKVIPGILIKPVLEKAKEIARGTAETLSERRKKALSYFEEIGISKERVLKTIDKRKEEDINLDDLEILVGIATAIKEGTSTPDEAFPETNQTPFSLGALTNKSGETPVNTDDSKAESVAKT